MMSVVVFIALIAINIILSYLFFYRYKAERVLARELFDLGDNQKHYLNVVLEKERLEINDQDKKDTLLLSELEEAGWITRFDDSVYVADGKLKYLKAQLNN